MQQQIIINGITYNSPDEMPPDVRAQYDLMGNLLADKNQNGMPDIVENAMQSGTTVMQTSALVYEGKTYARAEDLPPEARAEYEQAMAQLADHNRDGVQDVLENSARPVVVTTTMQTAPHNAEGQNVGPIVVLTVVALGLAAILAIMLFLLSARMR